MQMAMPAFHLAFQFMIFAALLESGTGTVHAINERIAAVYSASRHRQLPNYARLAIAGAVLTSAIFIADRFGLVTLIAQGYRALSYTLLIIYVLPLLTYGLWQLRATRISHG
jgi:uncharacterized membrane protein YkvI